MIEVYLNKYKDEITLKPISQWDFGRTIIVKGLEVPNGTEAHFAEINADVAKVAQFNENIVQIPNYFLCQEKDVICYIYLNNDVSGKTVKKINIPIIKRAKPEFFETPEQEEYFRQVISELKQEQENLKEQIKNIEIGETNKDYSMMENKPSINSVQLDGNKTLEELGIMPNDTHIPTNVSELNNDKQYITSEQLEQKGYAEKNYVDAELGKKANGNHTHGDYVTFETLATQGYAIADDVVAKSQGLENANKIMGTDENGNYTLKEPIVSGGSDEEWTELGYAEMSGQYVPFAYADGIFTFNTNIEVITGESLSIVKPYFSNVINLVLYKTEIDGQYTAKNLDGAIYAPESLDSDYVLDLPDAKTLEILNIGGYDLYKIQFFTPYYNQHGARNTYIIKGFMPLKWLSSQKTAMVILEEFESNFENKVYVNQHGIKEEEKIYIKERYEETRIVISHFNKLMQTGMFIRVWGKNEKNNI